MTAVTALQTDSWFGKLLKMALTASGVKYNIAQNGYVCFGSLFGGLIIQWGTSMTRTNLILPISFTSPFAAVASHEGTDPAINIIVYENLSKLWDNWDRGANKAFYVAIGR